jgi:hypothetical protein
MVIWSAAVLRALAYTPLARSSFGIRATEARRVEMTNYVDIEAIRHERTYIVQWILC